MANPILTDDRLRKAAGGPAEDEAGWAAPARATTVSPEAAPDRVGAGGDGHGRAPVTGAARPMTVGGTTSATGVLLVLLMVAAAFGWMSVPVQDGEVTSFPAISLIGVLVGFAAVIACAFRPQWARFLAPVYALGEGFFLGAISKAYDAAYDGIVLSAIGATVAVFAVMLILYVTRVIKVTDKFRMVVIGATFGIMLFYLVSVLFSLFGASPSYFTSTSLLAIGINVIIAGVAALNLALDFDIIERGVAARYPRSMEWYCGLGLLVTLVWLYLEMLRLLSRIQGR